MKLQQMAIVLGSVFGTMAMPVYGQSSGGKELPTIEVKIQDKADPYKTPAPVSTISDEQLQKRDNGDVNQALRNTAGVYTLQDQTNPGISVNIRGMSGYGRVNTMIDGVPQTFRNAAGHGAYGGTRLYVHPELIAGIDVTRGVVSGAHGSGTLVGAADFRTLDASDVILPDRNWGLNTRIKMGNNGADRTRMIAGGVRTNFLDGDISFVGAIADSDNSIYKNGNGVKDYIDNDGHTQNNPINSPEGSLLKLAIRPNDRHLIKLGYVDYSNLFTSGGYRWDIDNKTYTMNYEYTPGNQWIDARFNVYRNETKMGYVNTSGSYAGRKADVTDNGGDISNTSRFMLGQNWQGSLFYGLSYNSDNYDVTSRGANAPGKLEKSSAFTDFTMSRGIFSVTAGLRYDAWKLSGVRQAMTQGTGAIHPDDQGRFQNEACPVGPTNCPEASVNRDGNKLNPSLRIALQPLDWMQVYASYAQTYRPPTAQETFWGLVPFGTAMGQGVFNNMGLKPETSRGFDIGVNLSKKQLLTATDEANLKVGYFDNKIENFITNDLVRIDRTAGATVGYTESAVWVNVPGTTKMHGVEIEGGYDLGYAYTNISFTDSTTKTPMGWGGGVNVRDDWTPDKYYTLDLGFRMFERRLVLGGKIRYTGKSSYAAFAGGEVEQKAYKLYDLYGSFKLTKNSDIFFTIENASDVPYRLATNGETTTNEAGRGRTFIAGISARF